MNRKEFLKRSAQVTLGLGFIGYSGGLGYSYFANSEYKTLFPEVKQNQVNLPANGKTVCIMGGGLAGIQAACELADRGFKVIVLEKTAFALGKLKAWRDTNFAPKLFGTEGYSREHGLHGVWGFYKNLREFLARHKIPLNTTKEEDSFYFFISNRGVQNKIKYPTWPIPFDRFQMFTRGNLYIPSRENIRIAEEGLLQSLNAASKMWGFDFLQDSQRLYLDSLSFYDWAKKIGVGNEFIKHYYEGIAEMGYFMSTKECSSLAIANFMKLGSLPTDSRVDYYKYPIDKTLIEPLLKHIQSKGGEIHYLQEVTNVVKENGKIVSVTTNEHIQGKKRKRCRVCGNIMGDSEYEHCPFCGAHPSMLEVLQPSESHMKTFTADYFVNAMDVRGAKNFVIRSGLEDDYFQKIKKLSTASIFCVNLLYENTNAWSKRFPPGSEYNTANFMPTGYEYLGFTSNWSVRQMPFLQKKKAELIEVQVSKVKKFKGKSYSEIAQIVHKELVKIVPDLPEFSEYYINFWNNYTGHRPGDEANRPAIQSPVENLLFIGDWVYIPHHAVFMEKTNVAAKILTNTLLDKIASKKGKIKILKSGTPDWQLDFLGAFTSVKA